MNNNVISVLNRTYKKTPRNTATDKLEELIRDRASSQVLYLVKKRLSLVSSATQVRILTECFANYEQYGIAFAANEPKDKLKTEALATMFHNGLIKPGISPGSSWKDTHVLTLKALDI